MHTAYPFARLVVQDDALERDDAAGPPVARAVHGAVRALADAVELLELLHVAAGAQRLEVALGVALRPRTAAQRPLLAGGARRHVAN